MLHGDALALWAGANPVLSARYTAQSCRSKGLPPASGTFCLRTVGARGEGDETQRPPAELESRENGQGCSDGPAHHSTGTHTK